MFEFAAPSDTVTLTEFSLLILIGEEEIHEMVPLASILSPGGPEVIEYERGSILASVALIVSML